MKFQDFEAKGAWGTIGDTRATLCEKQMLYSRFEIEVPPDE